MELNRINEVACSLVSFKIQEPTKEGEKTTLSFFLQDFTEEIGKKGAKVIVPCAISKRSINSVVEICTELTDQENKIDAIGHTKGFKIVSLTDKKIPGYGAWLDSRQEFTSPEEKQMATKAILAVMVNTISENEKVASLADPLLEAKRIFAKSAPVANLNFTNPMEVFAAWETEELTRIQRIMDKAKSLSGEDLKTFINEKVASNGLNEEGYVMLRGKKESTDELPSK